MRTTPSRLVTLADLMCSMTALAKPITKPVRYLIDKVPFESVAVYDDAAPARPALLMVPNWLGINEANLKQAQLVAARGYSVFVVDMYGVDKRPSDSATAGKAVGPLKENRALTRQRIRAGFDQLQSVKSEKFDLTHQGAIGFCFGGLVALELGRSGANVAGIVTFHAGLSSPTPEDAKNIKGRVLALHGADDPSVPAAELQAFQDEMRGAKLDWQLVSFGNAVHSFTDVDAKMPGRAEYNPLVARRAYQLMDSFFAETFNPK